MKEFMSRDRLVEEATRISGQYVSNTEEALEVYWGNGLADEQDGSVTEPPYLHVFRVANWILWTDGYGFKAAASYDNAAKAHDVMVQFDQASNFPIEFSDPS